MYKNEYIHTIRRRLIFCCCCCCCILVGYYSIVSCAGGVRGCCDRGTQHRRMRDEVIRFTLSQTKSLAFGHSGSVFRVSAGREKRATNTSWGFTTNTCSLLDALVLALCHFFSLYCREFGDCRNTHVNEHTKEKKRENGALTRCPHDMRVCETQLLSAVERWEKTMARRGWWFSLRLLLLLYIERIRFRFELWMF